MSTIVAVYISSSKLREQGVETLEGKTNTILTRMEAVRTYVATQVKIGDEIKEVVEKYPDGAIPEYEREAMLKMCPSLLPCQWVNLNSIILKNW